MDNCKCTPKDGCIVNNYYTCCNGGGTGETEPYYDDYIVGQEVLTNKRYNGKPVYRKLIQVEKINPGAGVGKPGVSTPIPSGLNENDVKLVAIYGSLYNNGNYDYALPSALIDANQVMNTTLIAGRGLISNLSIVTTTALPSTFSIIVMLEYTKNAGTSVF